MELNMVDVTRLVPARSAEVLTECQKLASERLPGPLKTALDKVDDALFELANKADSSHRQNLYFDAMRELRLKRDSFETDFIDTFNNEFEHSIDLGKATKKTEAVFAPVMEWSLVESDEVEESLAVTNFVQSVKSNCKEQLFGLDRRIGYLLCQPDLNDDDNPIGPQTIGNAFREACRGLESDIEVKLTLFKMFDKFGRQGIHQMYRDLNDFLVQRDILPKITTTARQQGSGRKTRVIIESEDGDVEATGTDVFSTLQSLMTSPSGGVVNRTTNPTDTILGTVPNGAVPGGYLEISDAAERTGPVGTRMNGTTTQSGTYSVGQSSVGLLAASATASLVNNLTKLQQGNLSGLEASTATILDAAQIQAGNVNVLRTIKESGAVGEVNPTDDLTLDIVTILFDYILDDPAIPDAMKALIGRLQIPLLKVALLDKALFSNKTHPARRLLDRLAAAAVGWSELQGADDGLYNLVDKLIHRVIDEFEDDISIFEMALVDLEEFLDAEHDEAERRVAESTSSLRTREQIVLAKMAVDDAINARIGDHEIREFIRQFLFDYWRQLLIITHVEHGVESEIWRDQLAAVDDLVWSIQDKPMPEDRKALTEKLPQLLKRIKRGMVSLEMDPDVCAKFMSMLASVHVVSVKHTAEESLAERHLSRGTGQNDRLTREAQDNHEFVNRRLANLFGSKDVGTEELDIDLSAFDDDPDPEPEPDQIPLDIMEFVNQVTELDLGDWIEFDSEDGCTMRARFTWISPATGRYLFTTRQGKKALDTTLTGLADQFAKGAARRIDTNPDPIFDRAIGDLLEKLEV